MGVATQVQKGEEFRDEVKVGTEVGKRQHVSGTFTLIITVSSSTRSHDPHINGDSNSFGGDTV